MRFSLDASTLFLIGCLGLGGCRPNGPSEVTPGRGEVAAASATATQALVTETPSRLLLISKERLEALRRSEARSDPAVKLVLDNASANLEGRSRSTSSPENMALAYLISGDKKYCETALRFSLEIVKEDNVRASNYLYFGDLMRPVAVTLNWCAPVIDEKDEATLVGYLTRWTEELWFDNKGHGWGLADPGNNFHYAFLEGTAFAGYALAALADPNGKRYIDLVIDRIERPDGALSYLRERLPGGGWTEGVNYGQRAKQRLFNTLSLIASMGGTNYFLKAPFFENSILYAIYQTQPGWRAQHPVGDLARTNQSPPGPYDRHYVQIAVRWLEDERIRGLGQWYLDTVATSLRGPDFDWREGYFYEPIHAVAVKPIPPSSLPTHYVARGEGFVHARSSWNDDATSVTITAPSIIDQSHAHFDAGAFVLYRGDWLIADAESFSRPPLLWQPGAHSGIDVEGAERRYGARLGGLERHHADGTLLYAKIDTTGQYRKRDGSDERQLLEEHTRELVFLSPDHVVTFDRVRPRPGEKASFRAHFPKEPKASDGRYVYGNARATVALELLTGGPARVESDRDLNSAAFRVVVPPAAGRVLAAFSTAAGTAPPKVRARLLPSEGQVTALVLDGQVVVFSANDRGAPAALPFHYTLPDASPRQHTIVNLEGGIAVATSNGGRRITVSRGSELSPNEAGLVRFER